MIEGGERLTIPRPLHTTIGEPRTSKQLASSPQTVRVHFIQGPGAEAQIREWSLIKGRGGGHKKGRGG